MASIKKRNGSYTITVSAGRDYAGKQIRHYTTYTPSPKLTERQEKKELDRIVFEFEEKVRCGRLYEGDKMTLAYFSRIWLEEYAKPNLRQRTYESYQKIIERIILPHLGHVKMSLLTPLHIEEFKNKMRIDGIRADGKSGGYSPSAAMRYFAILSSMLSTAVRWNMIDENPCSKVGAPKQNRAPSDIKHFTLEQATAFLQSLEDVHIQHKALSYLALLSGIRVGELCALTWSDVDFENQTISINKSTAKVKGGQIITPPKNKGSVRTISIPENVVRLLKSLSTYQKTEQLRLGSKWIDTDYVFKQWNGLQINYYSPSHWFRRHLAEYNSKVKKEEDKLPVITFHGLRHTSATLLIAEHIDVKTVSTRLGHAQTSTTMNIYAHSLKKSDEDASNRLGALLDGEKPCATTCDKRATK